MRDEIEDELIKQVQRIADILEKKYGTARSSWRRNSARSSYNRDVYACENCGHNTDICYDYCPCCGCRMRDEIDD